MLNTLDPTHYLNRYDRPSFITRGSIILCSNADAKAMLLTAGADVAPLLGSLWEQVETMGDGELFTSLQILDKPRQASICRVPEGYLFQLDDLEDEYSLQALALAAQKLREPLSETLLGIQALEKLIPPVEEADASLRLLRRSYYRLLRLTENMTAGHDYLENPPADQEATELGGFFDEIFKTAAGLMSSAQKNISFHAPSRDVVAYIDRQAVERCVYNLLSNALQFLPQNGHIHGELLRTASHAILRVTDNGEGLRREIRNDLFTRYRRRPTIEDGRLGLGLGLCIVRSIVTAHGGAVYAGALPNGGTEVAISLSLSAEEASVVRSRIKRPKELCGLHLARTELSNVLPNSEYGFI